MKDLGKLVNKLVKPVDPNYRSEYVNKVVVCAAASVCQDGNNLASLIAEATFGLIAFYYAFRLIRRPNQYNH